MLLGSLRLRHPNVKERGDTGPQQKQVLLLRKPQVWEHLAQQHRPQLPQLHMPLPLRQVRLRVWSPNAATVAADSALDAERGQHMEAVATQPAAAIKAFAVAQYATGLLGQALDMGAVAAPPATAIRAAPDPHAAALLGQAQDVEAVAAAPATAIRAVLYAQHAAALSAQANMRVQSEPSKNVCTGHIVQFHAEVT